MPERSFSLHKSVLMYQSCFLTQVAHTKSNFIANSEWLLFHHHHDVLSPEQILVVMNLHFPHFLALMMSSAKLHPVQNCMLFSHLHFSLPLTALPSAIFSSMVFSILLCIFWCGQRLLLSWFLFLWVVHAVVALILVHLIFSFFKIHDLHSCRSILLNSTASMSSRWRARWQTFFKAPAGMQNSAGCCLISHVF